MKTLSHFCALVITLVSLQQLAHADAVLSQSDRLFFPTDVRAEIEINAQVEVSSYLFDFAGVDEVGDYVLTVPSPKGAYVIGVDIDRGEGFVPTAMVGEVPPAAVGGNSAAQDPEVQAWLGTRPLRADFAELATGPFTVRVRFQRLLRRYQGAVDFETGVLRSPLRDSDDLGAGFTGLLNLTSSRALRSLDVTGPGAEVDQEESSATISWSASEGDARIGLRYQLELADVDMHFYAHRTPSADPMGGEEGYFMLIVDADNASEASAQARSLSLVIDESGSMAGGKISEAREAARAMLDHLGPQDSFNIISFEGEIDSFRDSPVPATEGAIEAARDFIKGIEADGGTDLDSGIVGGLQGIDTDDPDRFDAMILLSDGQATSGETDPIAIHDNALQHNLAKARIFSFSVGTGADHTLLEALARSNRGRHFDLNDAQATQEMLQQVNQLFEDIRVVRLTDLEVQLSGISSYGVLPEQMQDLFSGGQAVLVGRYSTSGNGAVNLSGNDRGAGFLQSVSIDAPALEADNAFVKYLWATEKVASLLAEMSTGGDVEMLREEITAIGLAYRIQTPYTSFSTGSYGGGGGSSGGGSGGYSGGGCELGQGSRLPRLPIAFGLLFLAALLLRKRNLPCSDSR